MRELMTLIFFGFDILSFLLCFISGILLTGCISDEKYEESGNKSAIMDVPQMFLKAWFRPEKYWVLYLNRIGWVGVVIFSTLLYLLMSNKV